MCCGWIREKTYEKMLYFFRMILTRIRNDGNVTKNVEKNQWNGFSIAETDRNAGTGGKMTNFFLPRIRSTFFFVTFRNLFISSTYSPHKDNENNSICSCTNIFAVPKKSIPASSSSPQSCFLRVYWSKLPSERWKLMERRDSTRVDHKRCWKLAQAKINKIISLNLYHQKKMRGEFHFSSIMCQTRGSSCRRWAIRRSLRSKKLHIAQL